MKKTTEQQTHIPTEKTGNEIPYPDKTDGRDKPLSVCAIREMTGIHDENLIHAILMSGASKREIQQAYDYCHGLQHTTPISRRPMTERAKNLSCLIDFDNGDID